MSSVFHYIVWVRSYTSRRSCSDYGGRVLHRTASRHQCAWRTSRGCLLALAALLGACESLGERSRSQSPEAGLGAEARPAAVAGAATESSTAVEPRATWQAEKPAGGAPVELAPVSTGLSGAEFYRGTGALVRSRASKTVEVPVTGNGRVSLNFANADIREVVDVILGDTLNLNYIIDPRIQGTVVARTSEPLDREAVIPALENILALNGVALRVVEGVYHVIPLAEAGRSLAAPRTVISGRQRALGFTVMVIPLRFASASSVQTVVADMVPQERVFLADPARNLLIFAGTGAEAADLVELVGLFDVDWMAGMSFALLPVEVAEVTNLVSELEQVFGQEGGGPLEGVVRFVPIQRLNAVLAISTQQAYLDRAALWIDRLDRGEGTTSRRIYVYYVQNSRAADLADVLSQIFAPSEVADRAGAELAPGLTPVELTTPAAAVQAEGAEAGVPAQAGGGARAASAEMPYGVTGRAGA